MMKMKFGMMGLLVTFACVASTMAFADDGKFAFAGTYSDEASGSSISVSAGMHVEIGNGAWAYSRPLITQGGDSYQQTGYYVTNGCTVPVQSFFDFAADGKSVDVEYQLSTTVINGGIFGCSFMGQKIERYHLVKTADTTTSSWARNMEGSGCGAFGAQGQINSQVAKLSQACTQQGGQASSSHRMAMCGPVDPNDMQCSFGWCTMQGHFDCTIAK